MPRFDTDVLVIGAGPAGLAAAIAARATGLRVTSLDRAYPPIDKTCGEGLMPEAVAALLRLGVAIGPEHGFAFRGTRFLDADTSVEAPFPHGPGIGVQRPALHQLLIDRAKEVGVSLRWGQRILAFTERGVLLASGETTCRWIVGADGAASQVRRWAGLDAGRRHCRRYGFRRRYTGAQWTECLEVYWGGGCQIYVTPIASSEVCVVALSRDPHTRIDAALRIHPAAAGRLKNHTPAGPERGAACGAFKLRSVTRGRIALIGDASGCVDPITGDGLSLSFRQSIALAEALERSDLTSYEREHRRLSRRPAGMAGLMLSLETSWLRKRVLRALSARPKLFADLLAMHVGDLAPADFVRHRGLPLGWQILKAF